jgi:hypothetical protein
VTGRTVALGYVKLDEQGQLLATPTHSGLYLECYGHKWPLKVLPEPPVGLGHATSEISVDAPVSASASA